jgi:hypothetical protein
VDGVGVGAGRSPGRLDRIRDPLLFGRGQQQVGDGRVPRAITGPEPSSCFVVGPSSTPGWSVAWVTSTTTATSGCKPNALVREPANVVSSCATASPKTSPGAPPAAATSRAVSPAT